MATTSSARVLSYREIKETVRKALKQAPKASRILVLTTDYSRHDFTDLIFRALMQLLGRQKASRVDVLNTAGTHRAMKRSEWRKKLGGDRRDYPRLNRRYEHRFDDEANLMKVGELPASLIRKMTKGYIDEPMPVTVNKRLAAGYDLIIAISGTVPHEGAGFSGGKKIFVPGIAGESVVGAFHWAAVLIGVPNIMGKLRNAARTIIDAAVDMVFDHIAPVPVLSFNMVYTEELDGTVVPRGLYAGYGKGGFDAALCKAAKLSAKLHIVYLDEAKNVVVQCIPADKYDEWWTAMKGSYKLQLLGVLAEGAEVILLAPHIDAFHSKKKMDRAIREIGYRGRATTIEFLKKNPKFNKNVAAHVINARGLGRMRGRKEEFPFRLTIASKISAKVCRAVGLGYRNPATIREEDFQGPGMLWIPQGGMYLYARK